MSVPAHINTKNLKFSLSKIPTFLGRLEHLCPQLQVSIHLYCWQQRQSHPSYGRSWPAMESAWAWEAAWPQQDIHGVPRVLFLASSGQGAHSLPKEQCLKASPLSLFKPAMTKHWAMHGRVTRSGNARGSFQLTSSSSFCPRRNLKPSQAGESCFESSISHSSTSSPPLSPPSHPHQYLHGNSVAEE